MPLFSCPNCGQQGNAPARNVTYNAKCRKCGQPLKIPAAPTSQPPIPQPPAEHFEGSQPPLPPGPGCAVAVFWFPVAIIAGGIIAVMVYLSLSLLVNGAPAAALLLVPLNPLVLALLVLLAPFAALAIAVDRMSR